MREMKWYGETGGAAYEVEFVALDDEQLALLTLEADQVEPANGPASAHLRGLRAT